jgi:hypothetical protein
MNLLKLASVITNLLSQIAALISLTASLGLNRQSFQLEPPAILHRCSSEKF